jgi:hypothetical protein
MTRKNEEARPSRAPPIREQENAVYGPYSKRWNY